MNNSQFRIALLTFVFGMVSVSFFNAEYDIWTEIQIDAPQVESEPSLICDIYPTKRVRFDMGAEEVQAVRLVRIL